MKWTPKYCREVKAFPRVASPTNSEIVSFIERYGTRLKVTGPSPNPPKRRSRAATKVLMQNMLMPSRQSLYFT